LFLCIATKMEWLCSEERNFIEQNSLLCDRTILFISRSLQGSHSGRGPLSECSINIYGWQLRNTSSLTADCYARFLQWFQINIMRKNNAARRHSRASARKALCIYGYCKLYVVAGKLHAYVTAASPQLISIAINETDVDILMFGCKYLYCVETRYGGFWSIFVGYCL
jgi:hypothetical protein